MGPWNRSDTASMRFQRLPPYPSINLIYVNRTSFLVFASSYNPARQKRFGVESSPHPSRLSLSKPSTRRLSLVALFAMLLAPIGKFTRL